MSVYRMKLKVFTFSAVQAGWAGARFTHQQGHIVSDTFSFDRSVELLVYVILGGARTLFVALLGTSVLVISPELLKTAASYDVLPKSNLVLQIVCLLVGSLSALGVARNEGPTRAERRPERADDHWLSGIHLDHAAAHRTLPDRVRRARPARTRPRPAPALAPARDWSN